MPSILATYPIEPSINYWTCSQCGKGKLRQAYPCEICYAVLCEGCVDSEHERPTGEHGQICGETRDCFDSLESD